MDSTLHSPFATLFAALTVMLSTPLASAKVIQHLAMQVTAENPAKPWDYMLRGWTCQDDQSISLYETVANYEGAWKERKVSSRHDGNVVRFARDMSNFNHRFEISGSERCSRNYKVSRPVEHEDSRGHKYTKNETVTETETASIDWKCRPLAQFPTEPGTNRGMNDYCAMNFRMNGHNAENGMISRLAFEPYFRGKKIRVQVWAEKYEEAYAYNNCTGYPTHMRIITITQGVGGHAGENDFKFSVILNGQKAEIPSSDGLVNADLAYCDPSGRAGPVSIGISAVEEDLFFNDEYVANGNANLDPSVQELSTKTLTLTRQKWMYGYVPLLDSIRDWFTPTKNQVKLWMHSRMLSDQSNNYGLGYSATQDKGGNW